MDYEWYTLSNDFLFTNIGMKEAKYERSRGKHKNSIVLHSKW